MPRISVPLIVSKEDRIALERMTHCGDDQLEVRAKIVLACTEEQQNKEIASKLNVGVATVSKWKEAYRNQGLIGLQLKHLGGRPSQFDSDAENLPQLIKDYIEKHEGCSASEIAVAFQLPESKIHYELRKSGINLQRARRWYYLSADYMSEWNPPVLGLYWSYSGGVIITASNQRVIQEGNLLVGCLETRSSSFADELEKSVSSVSLFGLIETAATFTNGVSSGTLSVDDFVNRTIDDWKGNDETEYHVFSFGVNPIYHGVKFTLCETHQFESKMDMVNSFLHWMGGLTTGVQHTLAEKLIEELVSFHTSATNDTVPFVWYLKEVSATNSNVHRSTDNSVELLPVDEKNWTDVEQRLKDVLQDLQTGSDHIKMGALLYQMDEDGTIAFRQYTSQQSFPEWNSIDYTGKKGFEKSLSKFERANLLYVEEIAHENTSLYLESSKKKLELTGVFLIVQAEMLRERIRIAVPAALARTLRPRERFRTSDYRRKVCLLCIRTSFRIACDIFNELTLRKDKNQEIPINTFIEDFYQEGQRVRKAKQSLAVSILVEHGFNPQTLEYSGEWPKEWEVPKDIHITITGGNDSLPVRPAYDDTKGIEIPVPDPVEIQKDVNDEATERENLKIAYSEPDTDEFVPVRKRRTTRYEVKEEDIEWVCNGYVNWLNEHVTQESCMIRYAWDIEKSSTNIVYILCIALLLRYVKRTGRRALFAPRSSVLVQHVIDPADDGIRQVIIILCVVTLDID